MSVQSVEKPVVQVKVGDFFVSSWGYDQTNVDFYKVVGVTKSGKSVKVQQWSSKVVGNSGTSEAVVPGDGPRTYNDWSEVPEGADYWERQAHVKVKPVPVETKRLRLGGYFNASFTVNSYSSAHLWEGRPQSQTAFGFGH